jgi:hypothetical protein
VCGMGIAYPGAKLYNCFPYNQVRDPGIRPVGGGGRRRAAGGGGSRRLRSVSGRQAGQTATRTRTGRCAWG